MLDYITRNLISATALFSVLLATCVFLSVKKMPAPERETSYGIMKSSVYSSQEIRKYLHAGESPVLQPCKQI